MIQIEFLFDFNMNGMTPEYNYFRAHGNENWEFSENGLMRRREASINDISIDKKDRLFIWGEGSRPDDFPGLTELGL